MDQPNVADFVSKRIERFNSFEKLCKIMADDLKEMKYQVTQYEAKVQTYEKQILLKKSEIAELDETIKRRKIEATGSFNNIAGDLNRREMDLVKKMAELQIRERNVVSRAAAAEQLISKAEKVIGRQSAEPVAESVVLPAPTVEATALVSDTVEAAPEAPAPVAVKQRGRPRKVPVTA